LADELIDAIIVSHSEPERDDITSGYRPGDFA